MEDLELLYDYLWAYFRALNVYYFVLGLLVFIMFVMLIIVLKRLSWMRFLVNDLRQKDAENAKQLDYMISLLENQYPYYKGEKRNVEHT